VDDVVLVDLLMKHKTTGLFVGNKVTTVLTKQALRRVLVELREHTEFGEVEVHAGRQKPKARLPELRPVVPLECVREDEHLALEAWVAGRGRGPVS
jgi:hypothetical protein